MRSPRPRAPCPGWSEHDCYALLRQVRWPEGIGCPWCGQRRVTTHTRHPRSSRCRYLCLSCRRTFTDLTGAPFARTNLPLDCWFLYLRVQASGLRLSALAKELGVKWDTAASMERRVARSAASAPWVRRLQEAIMRSIRDA